MDFSFVVTLYQTLMILMICAIPVILIIKIGKWMAQSLVHNLFPSSKK